MTQQGKKATWRSLVALEAATLGAGALVGYLTRDGMDFFRTLSKPGFAPPGWLFPIVWSILYALMAYCMWLVLRALGLYIAQLAVNLMWPVLFFILKALGLSFFWLILLFCLIFIMAVQFGQQKPLAGWLLVPYLLWVTFAGVLNFAVARMNP